MVMDMASEHLYKSPLMPQDVTGMVRAGVCRDIQGAKTSRGLHHQLQQPFVLHQGCFHNSPLPCPHVLIHPRLFLLGDFDWLVPLSGVLEDRFSMHTPHIGSLYLEAYHYSTEES